MKSEYHLNGGYKDGGCRRRIRPEVRRKGRNRATKKLHGGDAGSVTPQVAILQVIVQVAAWITISVLGGAYHYAYAFLAAHHILR